MSIREAARFYNILSNALVGTWLKRFKKNGIKGLIPRKPPGRPPMKPKYAKCHRPPQNKRRPVASENFIAWIGGSLSKGVGKQVLGLQVRSRKRKKFTTYRGTIGHIAPNRLERDFKATVPNQKWVTDITEFKAKDGGKVYLSPILDLFNNEIVAFNLSYSPNWA